MLFSIVKYDILLYSIVFLLFLNVVLGITQIFLNRKKKPTISTAFTSDEYIVLFKQLDSIIHEDLIHFRRELHTLSSRYDLDKKSQTNSFAAFSDEKDKLIRNHTRQIINYIPRNMQLSLSNYFTNESLILYIYNKLNNKE
jgi:hypothetical protein